MCIFSFQKQLKFAQDNFTTSIEAPTAFPSDKIDSSLTANDSIDDLNFNQDDGDDKEFWTSDNLYASESSAHEVKEDINAENPSGFPQKDEPSNFNFKATDHISDRLPYASVQSNNSESSADYEIDFQNKLIEEGNNSSDSDLTKTQSKVVISQAENPTSSIHLFNPPQRQKHEFLSKRIDGNSPFSRESHKHAIELDRDLASFLGTQKNFQNQISSDPASNSHFQNQGASFKSDLAGKIDAGLQNLFHRPSEDDSKLYSVGRNLANKETLESGIGGQQYSGVREERDGRDTGYYDSDHQKNPVTRKITVVQEKTMRSISRKEEQESGNMPENTQGRFPNSGSIILKTQPIGNNILSHPNTRTKEETIVLVEGTHIPGKNYGPEDDLFGYHYNFYEKNPKLPNNQLKDSGDTGSSSHRIHHSNHGNGVSTQFFVNSQPSSSKGSQLNVQTPQNHYPHESIGNVLPIGNDAAQVKCHHDSIDDEPDANQEEIDPNQLYIDAQTGQLIKFVTDGDSQISSPNPSNEEENQLLKDAQAWSQQSKFGGSFPSSDDPKDDFNHQSYGDDKTFDTKRKFKIRRTPKIPDLSNSDLSSDSIFNKPDKENSFQQHDVSNNNFQYPVSSKGINLNTDKGLDKFPSSHLAQNDFKNNNNFDVSNIGSDNAGLSPEHHLHTADDNGNYGQKLNLGSVDYSALNSKGGAGHDFKSITNLNNLLENYGEKNGKSLHGSINQPANVNVDDIDFGTKLGSSSFKGSNQAQQGLFDKSKSTSYTPSYNGDPFKNVYFEFPKKKRNQNFNAHITKLNPGLHSNFDAGNQKGTHFHKSGNENENHNILDCIKSHNQFEYPTISTAQNNNKGSAMDIRKHPNYMASLQNLFGFKTPGFSSVKTFNTAKQNNFPKQQTHGFPKGDLTYLPEISSNSKGSSSPNFHRQFNIKSEGIPNTNLKGYTFQNSGKNNQQFGYEQIQNNGKFDDTSFDSGAAIGQHDNYNPYSNSQQQFPHFQQNQQEFSNSFGGINKHQQPGQYILVEMDDNGNDHTDSDIESYYKLYENNFKGEQVDLSNTNGPSGHSFVASGNSYKDFQSPKIRYVVNGGKDITFPLRRLATTGFHMARSVLPLMTNSEPLMTNRKPLMTNPKYVEASIKFGLRFNKRKGDLQEIAKS